MAKRREALEARKSQEAAAKEQEQAANAYLHLNSYLVNGGLAGRWPLALWALHAARRAAVPHVRALMARCAPSPTSQALPAPDAGGAPGMGGMPSGGYGAPGMGGMDGPAQF